MRPAQDVADERKRLVAELHCEGRSQRAIALMLGVTQPAVSKIIRRLGAKIVSPLPLPEDSRPEHVLDAARFLFLGNLEGEVRIKRTPKGWMVWHEGQSSWGETLRQAVDRIASKRYDFVGGTVQFTARVYRTKAADGTVSHIIESAD